MPENSTSPTAGPDFTKVGFGAMGNVDVRHDASQHTTHQVTHDSSTTSHLHHDDQSRHIDQSITKQTTIHQTGLSPVVLFALTCVIIAGFLFMILALKPETARPVGGGTTAMVSPPAPSVVIENKPVVNVTGTGTAGTNAPGMVQVPPPGGGQAPPAAAAAGLPQIELAEVGVMVGQQFIPRTTFKSGELLTLRLKVSRDCHVRVIYQPAQGHPVWMHPEAAGAADALPGGRELLIPDPGKLAARAADATAFELYHDTGSGPPIQEQILIQIGEEPFTEDGASRAGDSPYRSFPGLSLAEARLRGVLRLKGLDASSSHARMESLLTERTLPFSITP